jgi:PAS domain S-box-containing protein
MESTSKLKKLKLFLIFIITTLTISAWIVFMIIDLAQLKSKLHETVQSQAYILTEALKQHNFSNDSGLPATKVDSIKFLATLLNNAYEEFSDFGEESEFVLGMLKDDSIQFLSRMSGNNNPSTNKISLNDRKLAVPLRLALTEKTGGKVIGRDYHGAMVVAAYQPMHSLNLGLVIKTDIKIVIIKYAIVFIVLLIATLLVIFVTLSQIQKWNITHLNDLKRQMDEYQALNEEYLAINEEMTEASSELITTNENLRIEKERAEKNEDRYKLLFNTMTEGFALHEIILNDKGNPSDYKFLEINPAFETITGLKADVAIGNTVKQLLPALEDIWIERYGNVALTGEPIEFEDYNESLKKHFRVRSFCPIKGQFAVIFEDITDKQNNLNLLNEERTFLRNIIDNVPIGLYVKDLKGRKIITNRTDMLHINKGVEEIIGKTDFDFLPSDIAQRTWADDLQVMQSEVPVIGKEEQIITLDGQSRILLTTKVPRRDYKGKVIGLIGMGIDITDRKHAEQALKEAELKYRTIADYTYDWEFWRLPDDSFIYHSPSCSRITGYSANEFYSNQNLIRSIIHPDDRNIWENHILSTNTDHATQKTEFRIINRDGSVKWIEHFCNAVFDEDGNYIGRRGSNRDIGYRIEAEQKLLKQNKEYLALNEELTEFNLRILQMNNELNAARKKAEESEKLKTAFLCNMSHEIRTPMNAILGFSELLIRPSTKEDKKIRFSKLIKQRSEDLLNIITDILDVSKIEVGQMSLYETQISLNSIISELKEYYQLRLESLKNEREIHFDLQINILKKDYAIIVDNKRLKQILTNLLDNAIKFTFEGKVTLDYQIVDNNELIFTISDTGIGIPVDKQHIIFDRFRQAEDCIEARRFGGSGLGLSIVKGLTELMGGKIWFNSKENEGTSFYLSFPIKTNDIVVPTESIHEITEVPEWNNKTVLVVEDDEANAELLSEILSATNINIINAKNAREAIDSFKEHQRINLVLLDVRLPDESGLQLLKTMKMMRPNVPVIAQTAYASDDDQKECIDAGCSGYLSKPIKYIKLINKISEFI